ncbi:RNA polymerase Rpb4 [Geosmithia morbida]|uniref:DNA-directed RNA polymerase III subunit RPC9 n=1 Tax=Geosmithia morbida TaxID=1094350 RepID=A0A9P5D6R1_9HYPO|nr:RNA polymerase Rpb4 [Geosmithia morbida]KAF4125851.1 RNA polymerase Rpb4 [Geosmithia morbida]
MKVLEAQSAVLSNFEVYQHVVDLKKRNKQARRRGPPNYETVVKELRDWLEVPPSPMGQKPMPYNATSIPTLLERLRPYDLSKGEVVMVLNLRPASVAALNTVVEDMAERFTEEQQEELVAIVASLLGQFPPPPEEGEGANREDATMEDAAAAAAAAAS